MSGRQLVVFTDLDGTLLDHDDYGWAPARPALDALRMRGAALVLVSSKTRAEMLEFRRQLGHQGPFGVENGGALFIPQGHFTDQETPDDDGLRAIVLGTPYTRIRTVLERLREREGFAFEGFGDVNALKLSEWTGLSPEQARRAQARESSEPILFHGDDRELQRLRATLEREQLRLLRGGRFFSVQGPSDKGTVVRYLLKSYGARKPGRPPLSVALGDSENDLAMLREVDIPIRIPKKHGCAPLAFEHPRLISPRAPGPRGFRAGIEAVLARLDDDRN
ncbi:MAG: HAD-IIB family hydrolase [Myxococcales bacterium]|nr:HAD-IIB family hydrolase [Myxococcales bacterium]